MKSLQQILKSVGLKMYYYWCPDKIYLNHRFREVFGRNINWENPTTFNEKLQWLKIYDRNPLYTKLVDKYEVRRFIAEKIGEQYLIPCLGVWDRFEDIDFDQLPDQFVLKCTHDSHSVIICKDKSKFDYTDAQKSLTAHLKRNFYYNAREWPYKNIKPRIIAEKYLSGGSVEINDYKFQCFNGQVKTIQVHSGRFSTHFQNFYDKEWNKLNITQPGSPQGDFYDQKPLSFEKMVHLSEKLSCSFPEVRVDWYEVEGKMFFGELTFFDGSGFVPFIPESWDYTIGEWIKLPEK